MISRILTMISRVRENSEVVMKFTQIYGDFHFPWRRPFQWMLTPWPARSPAKNEKFLSGERRSSHTKRRFSGLVSSHLVDWPRFVDNFPLITGWWVQSLLKILYSQLGLWFPTEWKNKSQPIKMEDLGVPLFQETTKQSGSTMSYKCHRRLKKIQGRWFHHESRSQWGDTFFLRYIMCIDIWLCLKIVYP